MSRNAQTSLRLPEQRDVGAPRQASRAPTGRQPARRVVLGALVISTISLAALPAGALAAKDDLVLASRASGPAGVGGDAGSQPGLISADGRFATFSSPANNLSGEDTDGTADVFVRDLRFNTLTLVSRASGPAGAAGDGGSFNPSISADGRFVAFASFAKNLSGEDRDGVEDVFVRDLVAGTTTLVSRADGPAGAVGDGSSLLPSISADGHLVAFETFASNFSAEDRNRVEDVFVRDVVAGATTLVSRAIGPGGAPGDHGSSDPSISADGRLVTFSSAADNLVGDDTKATQDVFLRDLQTNRITLVSRASGPGGPAGDGSSSDPSISDGRFVAFASFANNLSGEDTAGTQDVFVRDLQTDATTLVSRAGGQAGAPSDASSVAPSISTGGRFVAFVSSANNLSAEDADGTRDAFVRDLQTGAVVLVSRASGSMGAAGDGDASGTSISADGRFVAFESFADNLSPDDADGTLDVFVRDIQGEPAGQAGQPGSTPAAGSDITGSDTTGPVILARALARGNGVVRVSKTGRFRLFCGRYREPVSGACAARALRPVGAARGLLLSSKLFRAPAGRSGFVGFRLSPRALASLTAARRVRMLGTVIARDRLGNATRVRFSFTLQAPSVATRRR